MILEGMSKPVGFAVVPGDAAASDLSPVSGVCVGDSLISVRHISDDLVTNVDVTGDASITDADTIQLGTTDTTGDFVVVLWQEAE